jgi:hypothetical protein
VLPLPRPPIKATHRPAVPGLGTPASCRSRAPPPPLARLAAVQRLPSSPSRLPNLPSTTAPVLQAGASPDRAAPRPGRLGAAGRPCTGDFPPIYGHKPVYGEPLNLPHPSPGQIRHRSGSIPASRAGRSARDHIAKLEFFSRASLQLVTQIVKVFWLLLVNCVENHRKFRKM